MPTSHPMLSTRLTHHTSARPRTAPRSGAVAGALLAAVLGPLAACSPGGSVTTDQQSYQVAEPVQALVVQGKAAAVSVTTGPGPVTVTEIYRYGADRPQTSHRIEGSVLHLVDTGCVDDERVCELQFQVRVPAETTLNIAVTVGAVRITDLAGDVNVTTEAGAVEGTRLSAKKVVVSTQAGGTALQFSGAPSLVRSSTELGAVEVSVPTGTAYAVDVHTTVGATKVTVPQDPQSDHTIEVRAEMGAVSVTNG